MIKKDINGLGDTDIDVHVLPRFSRNQIEYLRENKVSSFIIIIINVGITIVRNVHQ